MFWSKRKVGRPKGLFSLKTERIMVNLKPEDIEWIDEIIKSERPFILSRSGFFLALMKVFRGSCMTLREYVTKSEVP